MPDTTTPQQTSPTHPEPPPRANPPPHARPRKTQAEEQARYDKFKADHPDMAEQFPILRALFSMQCGGQHINP